MTAQALIFDCDGTLADSMPLHWRAWKEITDRHQIKFPQERFYSLGGVPARDILKLLAQEQGRDSMGRRAGRFAHAHLSATPA